VDYAENEPMKKSTFAGVAIPLSVIAPMYAAAANDEQAILQLEHRLCDAFQKSVADFIAKSEDEIHTLTNSHSQVSGRQDDIADARSGDPHYDEFSNRDMKVRLCGDAAVVTGVTSVKGTSKSKAFAVEVQFTDTFIRRDGAWKIVAGHATKLERQ
jgi:ketosteroid isomerase-like protein